MHISLGDPSFAYGSLFTQRVLHVLCLGFAALSWIEKVWVTQHSPPTIIIQVPLLPNVLLMSIAFLYPMLFCASAICRFGGVLIDVAA